MASSHPLALDPDAHTPTPLIILPRSVTPSEPRQILGAKSDHLDTPTSQISSLAALTIRPSPAHSLQTTMKGDMPHLNSYQQMLTRLVLQQGNNQASSSMGTVMPISRLGLARLKVDEMDFEVCFRCGAERDKCDIGLKELEEWGLQWVCKGRCEGEGGVDVKSDAEAEDSPVGRDRRGSEAGEDKP